MLGGDHVLHVLHNIRLQDPSVSKVLFPQRSDCEQRSMVSSIACCVISAFSGLVSDVPGVSTKGTVTPTLGQ